MHNVDIVYDLFDEVRWRLWHCDNTPLLMAFAGAEIDS